MIARFPGGVVAFQGALVEVPAGSPEYLFVSAKFAEGAPGPDGVTAPEFMKPIVKVQRVQHQFQWNRYYTERITVAKANGGDPNERYVFVCVCVCVVCVCNCCLDRFHGAGG